MIDGAMDHDGLVMWTIYAAPRDNPHPFVVRAWRTVAGSPDPQPAVGSTSHMTLEEARASIPRGLYCMPRSPNDDPVIVETWI